MRLLGETARETLWNVITAASSREGIYLRFPCLCIYTGEKASGSQVPSDHCREPFSLPRLPSPEPQSGLICRRFHQGAGMPEARCLTCILRAGLTQEGRRPLAGRVCAFCWWCEADFSCPWTWLNLHLAVLLLLQSTLSCSISSDI